MTPFHGFVDHFVKEMDEKRKSLEEVLLNGNFDRLEDYKRVVGERKGIIFAVERLKELVSLMEND